VPTSGDCLVGIAHSRTQVAEVYFVCVCVCVWGGVSVV
jgi:hypothetical protein